jgi:hypothetical protein
MRWGFYGLAIGSVAAYLVVVGGSNLKFGKISAIVAKEEKEEKEGEEEEGEEGEELGE